MAPRKLFKIGEIMSHTGLSRQTLHNYTMMGLIREAERTGSSSGADEVAAASAVALKG